MVILFFIFSVLSSCVNFGGATYLDKKSLAIEHPLLINTNKVAVMGSLKVTLTNDATSFIKASPSLLEQIEIIIQDETTIIRPKRGFRPYGYGFFDLFLGLSLLDAIEINTDQVIATPSVLNKARISISISGASYGVINTSIDQLTLNISSAKPLVLVGKAKYLDLTVSDIAIISLKKFIVDNPTINRKVGSVIKE